MSLEVENAAGVPLCLAAFARLAFVAGSPDRAAVTLGAAEGLRRRVGLRAWPTQRRSEAELGSQIEQTIGSDRFEEAFTTGFQLSRSEAVAMVRRLGDPA